VPLITGGQSILHGPGFLGHPPVIPVDLDSHFRYISGIFFAVGYYNLTAVELVAGVLIFSWIILFLRNAGVIRPEAPAAGARPAGDPDPDAVGDPAGAPVLT